MKTWIRRTLLGVLGASIAFGGLAACAHRHDRQAYAAAGTEERARMRDRIVDRVASRLDLNGEQKAKLKVLGDRLDEQRVALAGPSANPRDEFRSLVAGAKFDRAKAQALVNEKTSAISAKSPDVIAALGDFYDSLTPAQQEKVRDMMNRRHRWSRRG